MPVSVLLAGEAGIGKTRLVEEFTAQAYAQGARILTGSCIDLGRHRAALRRAHRRAARRPAGDLRRAVAGAARARSAALVPELAPGRCRGRRAARPGCSARCCACSSTSAARAPVVLVLEDVHWADRSTQEILKLLVRGLRQTAVLVVLTYRSDELHREHPTRARCSRSSSARRGRSCARSRRWTARRRGSCWRRWPAEPLEVARRRRDLRAVGGQPVLRRGAARRPRRRRPRLRPASTTRSSRAWIACRRRRGRWRASAAAFGRRVDHDPLAAVADLADERLDDGPARLRHRQRPRGRARAARVPLPPRAARGGGGGRPAPRARARACTTASPTCSRRDRRRATPGPPSTSPGSPTTACGATTRRPGCARRCARRRPRRRCTRPPRPARYFEAALELWDAVDDPERRDRHRPDARPAARGRVPGAGVSATPAPRRACSSARWRRSATTASRCAAPTCSRGSRRCGGAGRVPSGRRCRSTRRRSPCSTPEPSAIAAQVRARYARDPAAGGRVLHGRASRLRPRRRSRGSAGARREECEATITQFVCHCFTGDVDGHPRARGAARGPSSWRRTTRAW